MEQGPTEKTIIRQCAQQKVPLPARIANAPELLLGLDLYWIAFMDLTSCRNYAEGPISWLVIDTYARRKRMRGEQKEDLFFFVAKMDSCFLEHISKKRES